MTLLQDLTEMNIYGKSWGRKNGVEHCITAITRGFDCVRIHA